MSAPADPMTALAQAAASMHEMFTAYVQAGFTESQALYLMGQILRGMAEGGSGAPPS